MTSASPALKTGLVGLRDIAELLQVDERTPTMWQNRSRKGLMQPPFPEPFTYISHTRPVWDRKDVMEWAKKSGRLPSQRAAAAQKESAFAKRQKAADERREEMRTFLLARIGRRLPDVVEEMHTAGYPRHLSSQAFVDLLAEGKLRLEGDRITRA